MCSWVLHCCSNKLRFVSGALPTIFIYTERQKEGKGSRSLPIITKIATEAQRHHSLLPSYWRETVLSAAGAAIIACKLIWVPCQSGPSPPLLSGRVICEGGEILLGALEERSLGSGAGGGGHRGESRGERRDRGEARAKQEEKKPVMEANECQEQIQGWAQLGDKWIWYSILFHTHTHTHARTHRPFVIRAGLYRAAFTYQHYLSLCHSLLINLLLCSNPTPITRRARHPPTPTPGDPQHTETYTLLTPFTWF